MCLLLSRSFLYQSFVRYFLRNPSVLRTPLHTVCHTMCRLNFAIGSSFRSSEVRFEVRKFAAKFPPNFRTSKRNWELGNELRNRVLKSELKSTIINFCIINRVLEVFGNYQTLSNGFTYNLIVKFFYKSYRCLSCCLSVKSKILSNIFLTSCTGYVNFIAQYKHRTV